jgi:hypothetical protein
MNIAPPSPRPHYWFHAKRYGWGWGLPAPWQGWVILAVWLGVLLLISIWVAPRSLALSYVFLAALSVGLIAVCHAKGEPPRWHWGDRD